MSKKGKTTNNSQKASEKKEEKKVVAATTVKTDKKEETPKAASVVTPTKKEAPKPQPKKEETKKTKQTPPPADPSVEEVKVEEVTNKPNLLFDLKENQKLTADGAARFLDVAERFYGKLDANDPKRIVMHEQLNYNMSWMLTKLTVQSHSEKKEVHMLAPNDDTIVENMLQMFNSIGVTPAIEPHKDENGKVDESQLEIKFSEKDVAPETKKAMREEDKIQKSRIPELDVNKWDSEADARKGILYILSKNDCPMQNRFQQALMDMKNYRKLTEPDEKKREEWDTVNIGKLYEELIKLLGNKSILLTKGLSAGALCSLRLDNNPIFAHAMVKKNLPNLSEKEVADLIKSFIEVKYADSKEPIDKCIEVVNGILKPSRDFFLTVPRLVEQNVKDNDPLYNSVCAAKKIMHKFSEAYSGELPKSDPDYNLKATNLMIEIRNNYVDKDAQFALYTTKEYPESIKKLELK